MDDRVLLNIIEHLESQDSATPSEVAAKQATAMDYYLGKPFGTEEEGRSQVMSSDVYDVVEGLTPVVLKPFVSSDDIVRFQPEGAEDEAAAEQESDYINYVVTQQNDVFETLVQWVKTGLLQKNGVVKYWWDKSKRTRIERYYGVPDDVFASMTQDDGVTVIGHSEQAGVPPLDPAGMPQIDPATGQPPPPEVLHDVVLRISEEIGNVKYQVVPPEEIRINRNAVSADPKKSTFWQHRRMMTLSALREMGYEVDDDISDGGDERPDSSPQAIARRGDSETWRDDTSLDKSMREVLYRESYMLVDVDGDGIAELRKVCVVGTTVLANEETEEVPFCGWTPSVQPFQYDGRCPADETTEIQLIKTTVLRQTMDNLYSINNNRQYVSNKVNIDDLIDNQIGGIIRVNGDIVGNHVQNAEVSPIGAITMPMVEYFDSAKENRTGFTRYNQGTDSNSLNKTATGIRIISEAGNERVGLISRCFAEMGLKPLMLGAHGLCRRHDTKARTIKLRGKWVPINPRDWKTRYDMSVSVGLGSADKQMQLQGAQLLIDKQVELAQTGVVTPKNFYEAGVLLAKGLGEKNPDKYFTAPPDQPQEKPKPEEDPAFKLEMADRMLKGHELELKERELGETFMLKRRELDIKDRDSQVNASAKEGDLALKAQAQGLDMHIQVMQALQALQAQSHEMGMAIQQLQMQRQGQAHDQALGTAQHALSAQGQEHSQGMAEQSHELAAETAAQQAKEPSGQA
ncbi:MAG: hypothetical protein V4792_09770 [Pseudomonadota bacterium]